MNWKALIYAILSVLSICGCVLLVFYLGSLWVELLLVDLLAGILVVCGLFSCLGVFVFYTIYAGW